MVRTVMESTRLPAAASSQSDFTFGVRLAMAECMSFAFLPRKLNHPCGARESLWMGVNVGNTYNLTDCGAYFPASGPRIYLFFTRISGPNWWMSGPSTGPSRTEKWDSGTCGSQCDINFGFEALQDGGTGSCDVGMYYEVESMPPTIASTSDFCLDDTMYSCLGSDHCLSSDCDLGCSIEGSEGVCRQESMIVGIQGTLESVMCSSYSVYGYKVPPPTSYWRPTRLFVRCEGTPDVQRFCIFDDIGADAPVWCQEISTLQCDGFYHAYDLDTDQSSFSPRGNLYLLSQSVSGSLLFADKASDPPRESYALSSTAYDISEGLSEITSFDWESSPCALGMFYEIQFVSRSRVELTYCENDLSYVCSSGGDCLSIPCDHGCSVDADVCFEPLASNEIGANCTKDLCVGEILVRCVDDVVTSRLDCLDDHIGGVACTNESGVAQCVVPEVAEPSNNCTKDVCDRETLVRCVNKVIASRIDCLDDLVGGVGCTNESGVAHCVVPDPVELCNSTICEEDSEDVSRVRVICSEGKVVFREVCETECVIANDGERKEAICAFSAKTIAASGGGMSTASLVGVTLGPSIGALLFLFALVVVAVDCCCLYASRTHASELKSSHELIEKDEGTLKTQAQDTSPPKGWEVVDDSKLNRRMSRRLENLPSGSSLRMGDFEYRVETVGAET